MDSRHSEIGAERYSIVWWLRESGASAKTPWSASRLETTYRGAIEKGGLWYGSRGGTRVGSALGYC